MFLHTENSKNMRKISFELFIPVKTETEANSGSKPELGQQNCVFRELFFSHILLFVIIVHCAENFIMVSICFL